jgi:photosystem II stability/assembly factor-like uncharacterized protein
LADNGTAFRTEDGGRSWHRDRSVAARWGASLATWQDALDVEGGSETKLRVLVTHDGGVHWTRRRAPCLRALSHDALVDLATPRLGWLVCLGQGGAGQMSKAVYRTRDGGRSWRIEAETSWRRSHGGIGGYGYPSGISIAADGFGLLWENRGHLYTTRNGGRSWVARTRVTEGEIDFGVDGASLPDGRGHMLLRHLGRTREARLLATSDYGRTWSIVPLEDLDVGPASKSSAASVLLLEALRLVRVYKHRSRSSY